LLVAGSSSAQDTKLDEADNQVAGLEKIGGVAAVVDYERGRILARRGKWLPARDALEIAVPALAAAPPLAPSTSYALGECYDQLGIWDKRYEAYKRAIPEDPLDPLWPQASMRLGACLIDMRRPQDAMRTYEGVAALYPDAIVPLARLRFNEVIQRPKERQDFKQIEDLLKHASDGLACDLLYTDTLWAQGKKADARALLGRMKAKYESAVEPWVALAYLEFQDNNPSGSNKILSDAEQKFKRSILVRLTRARIAMDTKS